MENNGRVCSQGEFTRSQIAKAMALQALERLLQRGDEGKGLVYDVMVLNGRSGSTSSGIHWALLAFAVPRGVQ